MPKIGLLSRKLWEGSLFGSKWKVFEHRRPSIDRFRIRIDEEKLALDSRWSGPLISCFSI